MRHLFVASLLFADWCWRDPDSSCETDVDGDGWATCHDCDDADPDVNPGQVDVIGNCLDEDCDGVYELSSESEDLAEAGAVILCGQGTEEVGTAVLSLSETAPGTDALAVGAPLRNASGSVYLIEGAALKDRAGLLLPLLDVASQEIQAAPDQKDEAGSALAALSLDEDEAPQLFIGAPGFSNTQRAGAGAVYMISTGLEPGTTTLEWPSDDQCPTDLCLVNTFADGARLGAVLEAGWLLDEGSPFLLASAPGYGLDNGAVAFLVGSTQFDGQDETRFKLGDEDGPVTALTGPGTDDAFGSALAVASFGGDGASQVAVGASGRLWGDAGHVGGIYVVPLDGAGAGVWDTLSVASDALLLAHGAEDSSNLGAVLGAGWDLTGDGLDDLVAGTRCGMNDQGCIDHAYLVSGETIASDLDADGAGASEAPSIDELALAVLSWTDLETAEGAGAPPPPVTFASDDVDGDDQPDLLFGHPAAERDEAAVWVVYGPVVASVDLDTLEGGAARVGLVDGEPEYGQLGYAVSGGLTVDGTGGMAVGAPLSFSGAGALFGLPYERVVSLD